MTDLNFISQLPNFIENEVQEFEIQTISCHSIASALTSETTCLWLESGNYGKRYIFFGEKWSIYLNDQIWHFKIGSKQRFQIKLKNLSFAELMNSLEDKWLRKQHQDCHIGIFLAYESGWHWENRRRKDKTLSENEMVIFCPEAIITSDKQGNHKIIQDSNIHNRNLTQCSSPPIKKYAQNCTIRFSETQDSYLNKITQIKNEIRSGNSFQVNLSQEVQCKGHLDDLQWAAHLFSNQAAPYMGYMKFEKNSIISLSPERLVKKETNNTLITRPIAGTLPKNDLEKRNTEQFKKDFKELAEHNMLIDLERNDLGRVCAPGSVHVHEYLCIEELPHLYHLVSEVRGTKDDQHKISDIIRATFPGGTITGCPKLETMHIIDALENESRGAYTGSFGYINAQNEIDLNILIRSASYSNNICTMRFGGGIVWDSVPEKEYYETLAKAKGLILSLIQGGADFDSDHRSFRQFFL